MADSGNDSKAAIQAAMDRIRQGDANGGIVALDELIGRQLERYFKGKGVHPDDAEEMVWTLFARAARPEGGYRGDAPAEHWINTCKKHLVIDYWRSRATNEEDNEGALIDRGDDDPVSFFSNLAAVSVDLDFIECINRALEEFRRDYPERAAHIEWLVDGWSNEEIAEALNVRVGAARDRIYQTRRKLAPYAAPCVDGKERSK